jgi:hypothetical protein
MRLDSYYLIYLVSDRETGKPMSVSYAKNEVSITRKLDPAVTVTIMKAGVMSKNEARLAACSYHESYRIGSRPRKPVPSRRCKARFKRQHDVGDLNGPAEWVIDGSARVSVLRTRRG